MRIPRKKQRKSKRDLLAYFNGTKKIIILFICVHASGSFDVSIFRRPEYILDRYGLSALDVDGYALPVTNWILNHTLFLFSFFFFLFSFFPFPSFFFYYHCCFIFFSLLNLVAVICCEIECISLNDIRPETWRCNLSEVSYQSLRKISKTLSQSCNEQEATHNHEPIINKKIKSPAFNLYSSHKLLSEIDHIDTVSFAEFPMR